MLCQRSHDRLRASGESASLRMGKFRHPGLCLSATSIELAASLNGLAGGECEAIASLNQKIVYRGKIKPIQEAKSKTHIFA